MLIDGTTASEKNVVELQVLWGKRVSSFKQAEAGTFWELSDSGICNSQNKR